MPATATRIKKHPDICGGDACIQNHRIPVWVLVAYQRAGASDADILSYYPQLTEGDLGAAWKYVTSHKTEIDGAISENAEP